MRRILTGKVLDRIERDFEEENYHSESAMVMPLLRAASKMERLLLMYAERQGLGDEQDEIAEVLAEFGGAVYRCHP